MKGLSGACSYCGPRILSILVSLTTLLLLIVSLAYYGFKTNTFSNIRQCVASKSTSHEITTENGVKYNPFVFSTTMDFFENDEYQDLSHSHDHLWQELLSSNGGFLIKMDNEGNAQRHGIGMFHQLHCLQMIRRALQDRAPRRGKPYATYNKHGVGENQDDGHDPELHMLHCLDYLRQSIICLADDTIEPPKKDAVGRGAIDGMITHQCRNAKPLYDMAEASPPWYRYMPEHEEEEEMGQEDLRHRQQKEEEAHAHAGH